MTDLLGRLAAVFVEPATAPRPSHRVAATAPAPSVGVIAAPRRALALGATVALALARSHRDRRALLCAWPPGEWAEPALQAPPWAGARQLRRSLSARGIEAAGSGPLVRVLLPEPPEQAAALAHRAMVAASAPAVLVLAGPRPESLDELLLRQDAIVVAAEPDADGALVDLAVATLADRHPAVSPCTLALGPVARAMACAGLAAPLGAGRVLAPALATPNPRPRPPPAARRDTGSPPRP
jgi:hypothetical protein